MAEKARPDGLVVTDDGGNYYYLRPDLLAQTKVSDEEIKKLKKAVATASGKDRELSLDEMRSVAGGMAGTQFQNLPQIQHVASLKVAAPSSSSGASTLMCPW